MANKRLFVAFAIEDEITKFLFTGQAKNAKVPYEFIDMSVKQPYDENWKTNCRARIKSCHGAIALISKNTINASGEKWEIDCVIQERIPLLGIYIGGATWLNKPSNMISVPCKEWTYDNVREFIESL